MNEFNFESGSSLSFFCLNERDEERKKKERDTIKEREKHRLIETNTTINVLCKRACNWNELIESVQKKLNRYNRTVRKWNFVYGAHSCQ